MNKEEKLMNRLQEHYNMLVEKGYEVVALFLQGSQNYGLDEYSENYMSDVDSKALVLPSFADFVNNKEPVSKLLLMENNEHVEVKDIRVMLNLMKKANVSYLELLYTDYKIINEKYAEILQPLLDNRDLFATAYKVQFVKALYGMGLEKRKALCHPYPTLLEKLEKYGFDGKQLSHMVRLEEFLRRFIARVPLKECYLTQKRSELMNYKKQFVADGSRVMSVDEAVEMANQYAEKLKELKDNYLEVAENDAAAAEQLDNVLFELKYNILSKRFKEELNNLPFVF